jgi:hypothetical protein
MRGKARLLEGLGQPRTVGRRSRAFFEWLIDVDRLAQSRPRKPRRNRVCKMNVPHSLTRETAGMSSESACEPCPSASPATSWPASLRGLRTANDRNLRDLKEFFRNRRGRHFNAKTRRPQRIAKKDRLLEWVFKLFPASASTLGGPLRSLRLCVNCIFLGLRPTAALSLCDKSHPQVTRLPARNLRIS